MVVREREPTPAKSGKIRICLDPSQTLNKAIRRPKYIIPTLEENLHKLHGMKYMTVIDVKEAFQNIPLTVKSSLMTTMFTLWGRYRWHNSLCHCRMSSGQITWRMRTTVMRCHNCISHLIASRSCEPIPGFGQRIVAFYNSFVTWCTVSLSESSVAFTFWEKHNAS